MTPRSRSATSRPIAYLSILIALVLPLPSLCQSNLFAWGINSDRQLGDNTGVFSAPLPVRVHGVGNIGFLQSAIAVAAGEGHSLALLKDGTVRAWGRNVTGECGNGTFSAFAATPVIVKDFTLGPLRHIIAIAAGRSFSLALDASGRVWGWGENT